MTVTVESALTSVQASAGRLSEAVRELVLIAVEDQPRGSDVHFVTVIHDAALDIAGEAEQGWAALRSEGHPVGVSLAQASQAVAGCQAHVNVMGAVLVRELAAPARLSDLMIFRRNRGREAGAWATEIVRCIEACQLLLWTDMQPALLGYWQELADITNRTGVPGTGG
jgi:hypothetical protein